jgi:hypothetical protein
MILWDSTLFTSSWIEDVYPHRTVRDEQTSKLTWALFMSIVKVDEHRVAEKRHEIFASQNEI